MHAKNFAEKHSSGRAKVATFNQEVVITRLLFTKYFNLFLQSINISLCNIISHNWQEQSIRNLSLYPYELRDQKSVIPEFMMESQPAKTAFFWIFHATIASNYRQKFSFH
jgi:hypothetical protein